MSTMSDLNGFVGYLNTSVPFNLQEHEVIPADPLFQYHDFHPGNSYNETCAYPRFWLDTGFLIPPETKDAFKGCYNSEFDQYGDTEAFGVFPDWQRQLSRFASVQDRLREWVPSVRSKIEHFSCMQILMLDIDGFRLDKATQITVDAVGNFSHAMRECARTVGKENFFIPGEITGGNTFGSIYLGRGRQPDMLPSTLTSAVTTTNASNSSLWIRDDGQNALDAAAFHYSIYRNMMRFLGMDGILASGFDTPQDWYVKLLPLPIYGRFEADTNRVDAWNEILLTNDLVNTNTNTFDVRHMYGVSNQDVFRWPAITNGTAKQLLGLYITTLHMPGIPLLLWGEEQAVRKPVYYLFPNLHRASYSFMS
jgi:alpha-1,3-glucan synthase